MEKGPKYYVECNVDVEERERERERCVETHPHDKTWRKHRQTDRQTKGWQHKKYKKCTYNKAKLTQK